MGRPRVVEFEWVRIAREGAGVNRSNRRETLRSDPLAGMDLCDDPRNVERPFKAASNFEDPSPPLLSALFDLFREGFVSFRLRELESQILTVHRGRAGSSSVGLNGEVVGVTNEVDVEPVGTGFEGAGQSPRSG